MFKKRLSLISTVFVLCLLFSQSVFAQTNPAVVSGRVTNGAGQGIPKAKVTLVGLTTSNVFEANTSSFGYYSATVQIPLWGENYFIFATKKQHTCNAVVEFIIGDISDIDLICTPE